MGKKKKWIRHMLTGIPTCPYCGYVDRHHVYDPDETESDCIECDKVYDIRCDTQVLYSTFTKEEPEGYVKI